MQCNFDLTVTHLLFNMLCELEIDSTITTKYYYIPSVSTKAWSQMF